ncbi:MAG: glycosyltransferase [Bacteroidales bacterium]|nr:glycosyltransferase [Bacteroidales bacterium]
MAAQQNDIYGLFNDSFPPVMDGVTLTVQNYVKGLTQRGKKVTVVTPWNPYTPEHDDFDLIRYFSLPIWNRHSYRYGYPKLDPAIWSRVAKRPFKIVHAHCPFSSGRLALYCAKKRNIPLIATFHSKYRTDLEHSLPEWMVKIIMRRILHFFNSATEVWIPQARVEDTIREYGFKGRVTVVENGNDLADLVPETKVEQFKEQSRRELGWGDDTLGLLFVGQHIKAKGVGTIIESLAKLPKTLNWRMNFIGTGYEAGNMRRMVTELGLWPRVTFHGVINNREDLMRYYAASDLFLFPSLYDNAPLVLREAAAMGTPAILPHGSTASEVIVDGKNGLLTDLSADAYANLTAQLATNRQALRRIGMGARQTLTRSWANVMEEVDHRYNDIIQAYGNNLRQ